MKILMQENAEEYGVRALRYTVEADGTELAEIAKLVATGEVKPHVQRALRLEEAAVAMGIVEDGRSIGRVVLSLE